MSEHLELSISGRVAMITIGRPGTVAVLSQKVSGEMNAMMAELEELGSIGCVVITGRDRVFAAGADIREMQTLDAQSMARRDYFAQWDRFAAFRLPKIAAINGLALGGGCELAMMCDILLAADGAHFGQPEIKLGVMPGMGATQRLVRLIGRARAMELILTGRRIDAAEALRIGLVSAVLPDTGLMESALVMARQIASYSSPAILAAREAVNRADEMPLHEGILFERRQFHALFANADRTEGMAAFLEKRPAHFQHR